MIQSEVVEFVEKMTDVQREDNFGYIFFFVGDDHRLPFLTIGHSDNDFDKVSNLDREGIFRINIGVSRESFSSLFSDASTENIDYTILDVFLPHPHYAKQNFICILNPTEENEERTKQFIIEAHAIATKRHNKTNQ